MIESTDTPRDFSAADLNDMRQRVVRGEEVSEDELRSALRFLRTLRGTAVATNKASKKQITEAEAKDALNNLLS